MFDNTLFSIDDMHKALREFLSELSQSISINEELEFKLKIILNELVTNSFKYAQSCNYVRVLAKLKRGVLFIVVIDDSCGFDYTQVKQVDISEENNVNQEGGRGIYIVDALSDYLRYNRKGNIIAIKVNLV
jgi:anti-sigma regulatory factor (Ser/Thr protein kinase)